MERHAVRTAEETPELRSTRLATSAEASIHMVVDATPQHLQSFERDPIVALLALATNTGLARFRSLPFSLAQLSNIVSQEQQDVDPDSYQLQTESSNLSAI